MNKIVFKKEVIFLVVILLSMNFLCADEIFDSNIKYDVFYFSLKQGDFKQYPIVVSNTGNIDANFEIEIENIGGVAVDKNSFRIKAGESENINLAAFALDNKEPNIYFGRVLIMANNELIKIINTIIEVNTKESLYNVTVELGEFEGNFLPVMIAAHKNTNLSLPPDVKIELYVTDFEGNIIESRERKLTMTHDYFSVIEKLKIDPWKKFFVYAKVTDNGEVSIGSAIHTGTNKMRAYILFCLIFVVLLSLIVFVVIKRDAIKIKLKKKKKVKDKLLQKVYNKEDTIKELRERLDRLGKVKKQKRRKRKRKKK